MKKKEENDMNTKHYWVQTQQGPRQCAYCDKCDDPNCCSSSTCESVWPSHEKTTWPSREKISNLIESVISDDEVVDDDG